MTMIEFTADEAGRGCDGPVLVVEDDPDVRELIQLILEEEGLAVETATNGREALDRIVLRRPALVTLDLNLPLVNGEEVAVAVRAAYGNTVPIILISGDDRIAEKARTLGTAGYLCKPFDVDDLITAVRRGLALHVV